MHLMGDKGKPYYFKFQQAKQDIDKMMERLGLSGHNGDGKEVKLSDYLPMEDEASNYAGKKNVKVERTSEFEMGDERQRKSGQQQGA